MIAEYCRKKLCYGLVNLRFFAFLRSCSYLLYSEMDSRIQGSRQRSRTQKNPRPRPRTAFLRTDLLEAKDRNARGQGQGPRTQPGSDFQNKSLQTIFSGDIQTKGFQKFFSANLQIFSNSKITAILEPRTRNFSRT